MWDAEFSRSELDFEQDRTRWTSTNWTPPPSLVIRVVHHDLLLMVQKSGIHQLRLVVFAIVHQAFYITGACLGFLNHQQYQHSLAFISHVCVSQPLPWTQPCLCGQKPGVTTWSPDVRAPRPRISISVTPISGGTATWSSGWTKVASIEGELFENTYKDHKGTMSWGWKSRWFIPQN